MCCYVTTKSLTIGVVGFGMIGRTLCSLSPSFFPNARLRVYERKKFLEKREETLHQEKFSIRTLDIESLFESDVIFFCSSWQNTYETLLHVPKKSQTKLAISVSRSDKIDINTARERLKGRNMTVLTDCGLEPGLTEFLIFRGGNFFDSAIEAHIKCGGLVFPRPNNMFGYKALFGTCYTPFNLKTALSLKNGAFVSHKRFSGLEDIEIASIGHVECFHDGMSETILSMEGIEKYSSLSQKTIRWPGYVEAIHKIASLGLLEDKEKNPSFGVTPKTLFESLTEKVFKLTEDDTTKTILSYAASGIKNNTLKTYLSTFLFSDFRELRSMSLATVLPALFCAGELLLNPRTGVLDNPYRMISENARIFYKIAEQFGCSIHEEIF